MEAANKRYIIIHFPSESLEIHREMRSQDKTHAIRLDPAQGLRELRYLYSIPGESLVEGDSQGMSLARSQKQRGLLHSGT